MALANTKLAFRTVEGMLVISPRVIPPPGKEVDPGFMPLLVITGTIAGVDGKPMASVSVTNKTQKRGHRRMLRETSLFRPMKGTAGIFYGRVCFAAIPVTAARTSLVISLLP